MTPAIFIFELREKAVSRHIASNINGRRSTIDDRTTIPGYSISPDLYSLGEGSAPACRGDRGAMSALTVQPQLPRYFLTLLAISTIALWAERTAPSCQPGIQLMCSPAK